MHVYFKTMSGQEFEVLNAEYNDKDKFWSFKGEYYRIMPHGFGDIYEGGFSRGLGITVIKELTEFE